VVQVVRHYSEIRNAAQVKIAALAATVAASKAEADAKLLNHVTLLLNAGADTEALVDPTTGGTLLIHAAADGHAALVLALLNSGADTSAKAKDGTTALFIAAQFGHTSAVRALIVGGAPVAQASCAGWTPLFVAAFGGHHACALLLLDAGAHPLACSTEWHMGLPAGETPAGAARSQGHGELALLLSDAEAGITSDLAQDDAASMVASALEGLESGEGEN
jgi:ankyrin repeat protein